MVSKTLLYGSTLKQNKSPAPQSGNNVVKLTGKYNGVNGTPSSFGLDESILSKHSLLIGGTGCGKTTLFYHLISQVKRRMTQDDVMIVFDSKGDFYSKFAKPGDLVIGNSTQYYPKSERWNIFKEVLADGWDEERYNINAQEICKAFLKNVQRRIKATHFSLMRREICLQLLLHRLSKLRKKMILPGQRVRLHLSISTMISCLSI